MWELGGKFDQVVQGLTNMVNVGWVELVVATYCIGNCTKREALQVVTL